MRKLMSRHLIGGRKGQSGCKESGKEGGAKKAGNESTEEASFPPSFYVTAYVCGTLKERIFCGEMI